MVARDIYIAIMVAAAKGRGVHLSWEECFDLSVDDAIAVRAGNSLTAEEHALIFATGCWKAIDPRREREAGQLSGSHPSERHD